MIDNSFNALAHWDNPNGDRYLLSLKSFQLIWILKAATKSFPSIEILKTNIVDYTTNKRIEGIVGNNFSSYVRDYDFSGLLLDHNKSQPKFSIPDNFGDPHGKLFKYFVNSDVC
ncbi:DUF1852 family protein [Vibrio lentus]|nr:DUF1852 family protein [Vibrio lentus]